MFGLPRHHVVKAAEPQLGNILGRTVLNVAPFGILLKPATSGERLFRVVRADAVANLSIMMMGPVETVCTGTTVPETPSRRNEGGRGLPFLLTDHVVNGHLLLAGILLYQHHLSGTKASEVSTPDRSGERGAIGHGCGSGLSGHLLLQLVGSWW